MSKLIYIRVNYQHGIVLPLDALSVFDLATIKVVKNAGYSELRGLTTDKECQGQFAIIDSSAIDCTARDQRHIDELTEDLEQNQKALDAALDVRAK